MKQLIICKNKDYASNAQHDNLLEMEEGSLALFSLSDFRVIHAANELIKGNFAVVLGRGNNKMPIYFPEVDVRTLKVAKGEWEDGKKFTATITIPTTEKGKEYTVVITKTGTVFNERANWTFTSIAKDTLASKVAEDIVKQINANTNNLGVTATNTGGAITIEAVKLGDNFNVLGADELMMTTVDITEGKKAVLDKAYIQDLASRCAAGKGFNYLAEGGKEIYPGYPEVVEDDKYVLYSLRFAVPRVSAKQRDEVVYQTLHIAVPMTNITTTTESGLISMLDSIFGPFMPIKSPIPASISETEEI